MPTLSPLASASADLEAAGVPKRPRLGIRPLVGGSAPAVYALVEALKAAPPALGDLLVGRALGELSKQTFPTATLVQLALLQAAPHALGVVEKMAETSWRSGATARVEDTAMAALYNLPARWAQSRPKAKDEALRTANDVPWVVSILVEYGRKNLAALGALACQMVVVSYLIDPGVAVALGAAALLNMGIGEFGRRAELRYLDRSMVPALAPTQSALAQAAASALGIATGKPDLFSTAKADLFATPQEPHFFHLGAREGYFDNIVLGNELNAQAWRARFARAERLYAESLQHCACLRATSVLAGRLSGGALFAGTLLYRAQQLSAAGDTEALLTGMLPVAMRSFGMLTSVSELSQAVQQLLYHHKIYRRLAGEIAAEATLDPFVKSDFARIRVRHKTGEITPKALFARNLAPGRYTITGRNGAGKSMLSLALKMHWGEQAFYWPAGNHLALDGRLSAQADDVGDIGSSGQRVAISFGMLERYLQADTHLRVVLPDEWDANLDKQSARPQVDAILERLAERFAVIDVTHDVQHGGAQRGVV